MRFFDSPKHSDWFRSPPRDRFNG